MLIRYLSFTFGDLSFDLQKNKDSFSLLMAIDMKGSLKTRNFTAKVLAEQIIFPQQDYLVLMYVF